MEDLPKDDLTTPLAKREFRPPRSPDPFAPAEQAPHAEPEVKSSFTDLAKAAKDAEWVFRDTDEVSGLFDSYEQNQPRVSEDDWKELSDEWDEDQLEAFRELVDNKATVAEWQDHMEEFTVTNNARKVIAEHGLSGAGAQFTAAVLDPTFLTAATGSVVVGDKISGIIMTGQKIGRIGRLTAKLASMGFTGSAKRTRLAKVLAETAAADGAVASLRSQTTHDYSDTDMTIDMLAGLAMVGAIDTGLAVRASRASKAMEEAETARLLEDDWKPGDSAGAAKVDSDAGKLRVDDFGTLMNSGNPVLRRFAEDGLQDGIGGGSSSAAVLAARSREHLVSRMNQSFYELWKGHKKTLNGIGTPFTEAKEMQKLSEKVWESVVLKADHGPEINKVASEIIDQNKKILQEAKDSGLNGFDNVEQFDQYMRQEWDTHGWLKATKGPDALDEDEMVELVHRGLSGHDEVPLEQQLDELKAAREEARANSAVIREGGEEASDEAFKAAAKEVESLEALIGARKRLALGFTRRMLNKAEGDTRPLSELMEDHDTMVKWLREDPEFRNSSEAEIKKVVQEALTARTKQPNKNAVDRAKRRISIDPSASFTKGARTVRVADLMRRDAMGLQQSYIHEMTGNIAFARKLDIKGPKDWEEMKMEARRKEIERNHKDPNVEAKADKAARVMEEMKREVFGHNRYDLTSDAQRWTSALMKYNFLTTMGKAAFSATSEFGRVLAENRVRNVLKVLPTMHRLVTDSFRSVNRHSSLVKEVNSFNAAIGDEHLLRYFNSFDENGVKEGTFTDGALNKAEIVMHRGARAMAKASFLAPMDKMLRLVSFQSSMNSLYSHLMKGQKSRLAFDEMGLHKELRGRIKSNMERHGVETDAWGNVSKLNIEKWDKATADEMMDAFTVNGSRQVQKTIAGENTAITSHPWGRVFLQFRKFAIDSYVKHLRADIRSARNGQAMRVMLANTYAAILATAGYTARTHVSTLGMDDNDRENYLEERLAPDRLAANIAAYTPSTGTIVSMWNTGPGWLFPDAVVPVARSSGLDNKGMTSNPSFAAVDRFGSLFHDVAGSEPENILSKGRFGIPFQNTIWGDLLLNNAARVTK